MNRREYFSKMKKLCKQLNALIPIKSDKDKNKLNDLLGEMMQQTEDGSNYAMYWDRELFIDCNCNDEKVREIVLHSGKVQFEPSEDPTEHPGVVVRYKERRME